MTGSCFSRLLVSLPRPSMVTLHDIIMKHLLLPHDPSWNHCVSPASYPASCVFVLSLLRPASPCVLLCSPAFSCVLLHSPVFSCILLHSPASPCVCVLHLLRSHCPQNVPSVPQTGISLFPSLHLSSLMFRSSAPCSMIHSIPPFSLPFRMFSSEATSSQDFLSPHPIFFPPFP